MHILALTFLLACLTGLEATPVDLGDGVEIERQRLVKFPDDTDQRHIAEPSTSSNSNSTNKQDEAKRILEEIEKINHALGYVRKQPEQPKLPPILDSSQYLFPKPAVLPFHQQHHQAAGSNGETILIPSIRSIRTGEQYTLPYASDASVSKLMDYNTPARKHIKQSTRSGTRQQQSSGAQLQYYFRPNQVLMPTPQRGGETPQLPTHFVIPVRLYKLNKEEYLQKHAPHEYRVKGYKIVGDINHFYGKSKTKNKGQKVKSTPKYHLFFLPREMALNEDSTLKYPTKSKGEKPQDNSMREEKLTNRPFKLQATAATNNNNGVASNNSTSQVVRKRIGPKPLRNKETSAAAMAVQQTPDGSVSQTSTSVRVKPGAGGNTAVNANANLIGNANAQLPVPVTVTNPGFNSNFQLFNSPPIKGNTNNNNNNNNNNVPSSPNSNDLKSNTTTSNVIKNAFQNIFKFPFRQEVKPEQTATTTAPPHLETVPLQTPPKTFFNAQPFLPQPFLPQPFYNVAPLAQDHDYKWDDESPASASNTNEDSDSDSDTSEQEEKHIFGQHHQGHFQKEQQQQHNTNREAIKQGGIVIQRLKVRKGGIAIAGPGGVATAGSGGTAIVGPGGYALTHPRSLTIAGPGAKVIAIPPNVDLKDALQRTNLGTQSFPREGKVVATGPTVYYAPGTGTGTGTGTAEQE